MGKNIVSIWIDTTQLFKICVHFLDIAFINSYTIYCKVCKKRQKPMNRLEFRQTLIRNFVSERRNELNIPTTEKKVKKNSNIKMKQQKRKKLSL